MPIVKSVAAVLALLWLSGAPLKAADAADPFAQASRMGRGINILGDDPIWRDRAQARFQARHFAIIRSGGFQTVRVVLQAFRHMDRNNTLDPVWLSTLDWVVHTALDNHLMVVLDEHDHLVCAKDAAQCKPKLMAFWRQVAEHYRDQPNDVLFEILNEPNGDLDTSMWNDWIREALAIIRQTNPARTVIAGPGFWNGIDRLDELQLPEGERNLIVTVHYYTPMAFTHQGASWYPDGANVTGVTWGTASDIARLKRDFANAEQWAEAHHRPIFLGEFGVYDKAEMADRVRYIDAVAREAESHGWAWAYWQFDSDFIAYDIGKDAWVPPIWKALIPQER